MTITGHEGLMTYCYPYLRTFISGSNCCFYLKSILGNGKSILGCNSLDETLQVADHLYRILLSPENSNGDSSPFFKILFSVQCESYVALAQIRTLSPLITGVPTEIIAEYRTLDRPSTDWIQYNNVLFSYNYRTIMGDEAAVPSESLDFEHKIPLEIVKKYNFILENSIKQQYTIFQRYKDFYEKSSVAATSKIMVVVELLEIFEHISKVLYLCAQKSINEELVIEHFNSISRHINRSSLDMIKIMLGIMIEAYALKDEDLCKLMKIRQSYAGKKFTPEKLTSYWSFADPITLEFLENFK